MASIRPLSDAELDRLEALLASDALGENAMSLDAAQALICAVVSGPQELLPEHWLPVIFGVDGDWTELPEAREATPLLQRLRDEIVLDLYEGRSVGPILYPKTQGGDDFDFAMWALGYLEGVDLADPSWEDAAPSDEIDDLLLPFLILAGGLDHDPSLRDSLELSAQDEAAFIASCQEELSESIQDVYDFWAEVRRPKTVRREEAKVGRNDPCPCGSGRKYKLCHGADA